MRESEREKETKRDTGSQQCKRGNWSSGNPFRRVPPKWSKVASGCKWQKPNDESASTAAVAAAVPAAAVAKVLARTSKVRAALQGCKLKKDEDWHWVVGQGRVCSLARHFA